MLDIFTKVTLQNSQVIKYEPINQNVILVTNDTEWTALNGVI